MILNTRISDCFGYTGGKASVDAPRTRMQTSAPPGPVSAHAHNSKVKRPFSTIRLSPGPGCDSPYGQGYGQPRRRTGRTRVARCPLGVGRRPCAWGQAHLALGGFPLLEGSEPVRCLLRRLARPFAWGHTAITSHCDRVPEGALALRAVPLRPPPLGPSPCSGGPGPSGCPSTPSRARATPLHCGPPLWPGSHREPCHTEPCHCDPLH